MPNSCATCGQHLPSNYSRNPFPSALPSLRDKRPISSSELAALEEHSLILTEIGAEITIHAKRITELKAQADILTKSEAQYRSLLSPIRRIPSEVLSDIMVRSTPRKVPEKSRIALELSHVSYVWRLTALSTPALWNVLRLGYNDKLTPFQLRLTPPAYPLHAIVYISSEKPLDEHMLIYAARLRSMEIMDLLSGQQYMRLGDAIFPALEEVTFRSFPSLSSASGDPAEYNFFERATSIRKVVALGYIIFSPRMLPWALLTDVKMRCLLVEDCIGMLEACSSLVNFCIDVCSGMLHAPSTSILLPALHTLILGLDLNHPEDFGHFFNSILSLTPHELHMKVTSRWYEAELSTLLSHCWQNLRGLVLEGPCNIADLYQGFQSLLLLEDLTLDCRSPNGWSWRELIKEFLLPDPSILPNLGTLTLTQEGFVTLDDTDILARFIDARRFPGHVHAAARAASPSSLRKVQLEVANPHYHSCWSSEVLKPLRVFRAAGFDIKLFYQKSGVDKDIMDEFGA